MIQAFYGQKTLNKDSLAPAKQLYDLWVSRDSINPGEDCGRQTSV
jgi:hypothetical protein